MRHHQQACLQYLGTYLRQLQSTAEESKQPKVPLVACDIVRRHGPTVPWHLPAMAPKNGRRGEAQTLLSVATSAGTVCSKSALTCHGPDTWPKRGQQKALFVACDIIRGHGLECLSTYQQQPRRMDEEAKCKRCCLWPHQRARSMATQHLPAMTQKNGRRGKLHTWLLGCQHGGLRCCHERRGLMAKKKIVRIFRHIIPLLMPPHPLAFLRCRGALQGSKRLQHSSEWWWRLHMHPDSQRWS